LPGCAEWRAEPAGILDGVPSPNAASLRPPRHRVSRTAIRYWRVRALLGWLVVVAAQVVWVLSDDAHRGLQAAALAATGIVGLAHLIVMPQWRYNVHRWEVAPQAVYTRAGWVHQESRIAPISRIQTVDSERGPLAQLFGLADVTVTTASAAGPLSIEGLDRATAEQLVDELTTAAQATRGDAT
jgi:membrane protein YdbS with pleckstrin-like domain